MPINQSRQMKPRRSSRRSATNTGINFVPQQEAWVVERMGRYNKILKPVIFFTIGFGFQTDSNPQKKISKWKISKFFIIFSIF